MSTARRFVIVFVVDGLRPDAIASRDTPTLFRLRAEGVEFTNSHAVFPTVTRVNAATIATGMQPGAHGIVGNQIYVPGVDPQRAFDTGNFKNFRARRRKIRVKMLRRPPAPNGSEPLHVPFAWRLWERPPRPWSDKGLYVDYAHAGDA